MNFSFGDLIMNKLDELQEQVEINNEIENRMYGTNKHVKDSNSSNYLLREKINKRNAEIRQSAKEKVDRMYEWRDSQN